MLKNKFQKVARYLSPYILDVDDSFWNVYRNTLPFIARGGDPISIPFSFEKDGQIVASAEIRCLPSSINISQFALCLLLDKARDFEWDAVCINHINKFTKEEIERQNAECIANLEKAKDTKSYQDAFWEFLKNSKAIFDNKDKPLGEIRTAYESLQATFTEALTYHVHEIEWTRKPPNTGWRKFIFG